MKTVEQLSVKIFADGADLPGMLEMYEKPFIASKQVFKRAKELGEQLCVPSVASEYLELIAKPAAGTKE